MFQFIVASAYSSDGGKGIPKIEIRTIKSSCSQNCDGSAQVLYNNGDETLLYEWLDFNNELLGQSYFPKFENACEGQYKVRIVKKKAISFSTEQSDVYEEMNALKVLRFSADRKMKLSLGFEIKPKKEFKELNENLKVHYSLDNGVTWNDAGEIHALKSNFSGLEIPSMVYSTILPPSVNEEENVMVMLAASTAKKRKKLKKLIRKNSYEIFKVYRKYIPFKIESTTNVEVNSFVSHELYGNDGLISVQVSGGMPPYEYKWSVGSSLSSIGKLAPGEYSVTIKDSKECQLVKSFKVKPLYDPLDDNLDITLKPSKNNGQFTLQINRVYNKIIYMYIHSAQKKKLKKFFIHPLEKDTKIRVDLSILKEGSYTAEFVVEDKTKVQDISIIQ